MLPTGITNTNSFRNLYDSTLEFLTVHTTSPRGRPGSAQATSTPSADPTPPTLTLDLGPSTSGLLGAGEDSSPCSPCSRGSFSSFRSMRRELEGNKPGHSRARSLSRTEVAKLDDRCKMLEKTLKETRDLLKARELEIEKLKGELARADRAKGDGDQKSTQSSEAAHNLTPQQKRENRLVVSSRDLQQHFQRADSPWAQAMSMRLEQSAHARSLETFLTKTDMWSGAQIVQAVHDLNSEILQYAASASEFCTFDRYPRNSSPKTPHAIPDITPKLGSQLTRLLLTRDHSKDPILVQLALQGCIATYIASALNLFCAGFPAKSNALMSTIYSHITSSGKN
jgi:hypothetical protein